MKQELALLIEKARNEFVTNPVWRGMDLDFFTFVEMQTGLSSATVRELNKLALDI